MAFAQLTYRESLRDIEACLRSVSIKLYHVGMRGTVARNTLAHANAMRDWWIYADFAQGLIQQAKSSRRTSIKLSTPWTRPPSIYVWRCSRGRSFAATKRP